MSILEKIKSLFHNSELTDTFSQEESAKILVVDDVRENRMVLEVMLKKAGFEVVSCACGFDAVKIADQQDFDLILTDIYMDGMDGFETVENIRAQAKNKNMPIIAVTAADTEEEKQRRIDVGIDDYIAKPVQADNLYRRVNRVLKTAKQIMIAESGGNIISTMANDPLFKKAIKLFVKSLPQKIKSMKASFEADNMHELARVAHSIKGSGGMVGFNVYSVKAAELEKAAKAENPDKDNILRQIEEFDAMANRTKKICKKR